jgi:hypothetical protein
MDAATLAELQEAMRREARAELWRRREVWPLLEVYLDRDQLADMRAFMAGGDAERGVLPPEDWYDDISRQRGKSWKWCVFAVVWAHCHGRQFIKYAAQLGKSVRNIIRPTINALVADMPPEYREKVSQRGNDAPVLAIREDKVDHKWLFPNGSEIQAAGANFGHYEDLRGQKSHLNINDEAGFYDDFDAVQRVLRPQTQTTRGVNVYATTPPETPGHPVTTVMQALKAAGRYSHRTIHNHPRMTPGDIETYLTREALAKGMTLETFRRTTYYRREFLCMHVVEESRAIIPEWTMDAADCGADGHPEGTLWGDVLTREVERPRWADTYTFADFGFTRDPSAVLFGYWDFEGARLVVVDETPPLYRTRTDKLAVAYRERCLALWPLSGPPPYADARPAKQPPPHANGSPVPPEEHAYWEPYSAGGDQGGRGEEVLTELAKEHNLAWRGANKVDLEIRVNEVRRMIAAGKLWVHPRCVHLRKQLSQGLWADKAKTDFERTSGGHLDHLAALVDLVSTLDRQHNPVPVGWGFDHTNMVTIHSESSRSRNALDAAFGGM